MEIKVGKGLKDLLNENDYVSSTDEKIIEIPLGEIKPNPYQPRYLFDDEKISELADSIKEHGVFQPIIVKKMSGYYAIISGERRYRACKKLGLKTIPAIVRMYEKSKMIQIALIENLQREDLSPVEEAKAYMQIMRELDYNQREVGEKVGKSRSYVTNMLGILALSDDVLGLVDEGKISMGHARVLSKMEDMQRIRELVMLIIEKNLSVRELEQIATLEKKKVETKKSKVNDKYIAYESAINNKYGVKIKISDNKILINNIDEKKLKEIIEKIIG